jgi:DNA processing protein
LSHSKNLTMQQLNNLTPDSLQYEVALGLLPGIGNMTTRTLISYCGSAKAVFHTPKGKLLKIPGIGQTTAALFDTGQKALRQAEETIRQAERQEVQLLFYTHPNYPSRLKTVPDAPCLLYYTGSASLNPAKTVGIVGTRKATDYGRQMTEKIVQDLQKHQPLIVSGLAYGIDIAAHRAAVQAGLPTIGVMATGPDIIYPSLHRKTAEKMLENGGWLTEYGFGVKPDAPRFPARNRIIAALSDCTIIVEAAIKGGALITADLAHGYNKDVMAVPGHLDAAASAGCNHLIQALKAAMYTRVEDLEQLMNWDLAPGKSLKKPLTSRYDPDEFTEEEYGIIRLLAESKEELIDNISWKTQVPMGRLASLLLELEFRGIVKSLPGKKYILA